MNLNFEKIQKDFADFTHTLNNVRGRKLISFFFKLEYFNPLLLVGKINQNFDDVFIFTSPNNKRTFIGINSAVELINENAENFSDALNQYAYWKNNSLSNEDEISRPIDTTICCSAKFDPSKTHFVWNDFNSLRIYIPELIFSIHENEVNAYFNFCCENESNLNSKINDLTNYLMVLFSEKSRTPDSSKKEISDDIEQNKIQLKSWNDNVIKALEALKNEPLQKIVLSRAHNFFLNAEINWNELLQKLHGRFPDCYLFFLKKNSSIFFGSSPEMFLKVKDRTAEVESVAGSAPRGEKSESDYEMEKFLRSSEKNHQEHLLVSDFISDILIKYSNDVRIIEEKQIRKLDNIQHLITKISAVLNSKENLFELIDSLFPTPAVCGVPKDYSMNLIRELENHDRGLYSGLVGVLDFEGNCELAVSIRSALIKGNQVIAFAGAGLLKNSIPEEELLETELKLNPILSLFENENKS